MRLRTAIATATTAAVLATSGVAIAGAASGGGSQPPPAAATAAPATPAAAPAVAGHVSRALKARRIRRLARIRKGATAIIIKTIGIDRATLRSGLAAGQTIGQIATAHGSTPQAVIDALVKAATTRLDAAVAAHKIKAARATKIEAKLPARAAKLVNTWHPKKALAQAAG